MKKLLILAITGMVLFSSCSDEEIVERREDKIEGTWEFEKAFYKRDNALFRDNVLEDFEGDLIHFHADQTAIYVDNSLDESFDGDWFVVLERYYDQDDVDREFFLDMEFYDSVNDESFFYYGNIQWLTKKRLNFTAWDDNGEYTFKLRKVD